jgi:hypothetical protein
VNVFFFFWQYNLIVLFIFPVALYYPLLHRDENCVINYNICAQDFFCCSNSRCCVFSAVVSLVFASVQKQRFGLYVCKSRLDLGFIYVVQSFLCVCRKALYHIDLCAVSVHNTFIVIVIE